MSCCWLKWDVGRLAKMFVVKRDGRKEPVHFDKITSRIIKLSYGLNTDFCDPVRAACADGKRCFKFYALLAGWGGARSLDQSRNGHFSEPACPGSSSTAMHDPGPGRERGPASARRAPRPPPSAALGWEGQCEPVSAGHLVL